MLGIFKKEEQESMTEPLLTNQDNGGFGFPEDQSFPQDLLGSRNLYFSNGLTAPNGHLPPNANLQPNGYCPSNGTLPSSSNANYAYTNYADLFPNEEHTTFSVQDAPMFQIQYEKFPERVNKVQRRQGKKSEQRLKPDEAQVVLGIEILGVAQVADVHVYVMKVIDPIYHSSEEMIGPQRLVTNITQNNGTYRVSVDLDSVYETEIIDPTDITGNRTKNVKVYKLAKNKTDKANLFNLKVVVVYVDGSQRELHTDRSFIIIGRERRMTQIEETEEAEANILPAPLNHAKRPRTDTDESINSFGSSKEDIRLPTISPQSNMSSQSNSSGYNTDFSTDESVISASKVVAEKIKAKKADIGELIVARPIQVKGGDIAYHFILKNPDAHPEFMEGEVVGLFVNENGERVLDKLSQKNSVDAILKGVISRSQYLEAQTQPEGVRTETVCMFGMVPVRVRGSVMRGQVIYASPDYPGLAVSGSTVGYNSTLKNDAAAIGMAWQSLQCDEDEINLIHCLVSITMEVFHGMIEKKVVGLEKRFDKEIKTIHKARKKSRRRKIICSTSVVTFLALLSVLLWQLFMPGSAYRYWVCERGSISGHISKFLFLPFGSATWYWANGIEFEWPVLRKKLKDKFDMKVAPINGTGYHYYLNIDRCAYGAIVKTQDIVLKTKIIGGPFIFAVDDHCKHAWYHSGRRWCTYHSARELTCSPIHSDHKHRHKSALKYCT